jgi:2-dehydropantoate 2-reductase
MSRLQFAVFGAGGIGGYFAAVLARAGYSVGLIARGRHLDAIRRSGLRVLSPKGDFTISPARVSDNPAEIGPVDAVILAVKAWQVTEAAAAMRPMLASSTRVLPLQNGVEAWEQLEQGIGREHTLIGLCRIFASVVEPGCFRDGGLQPSVMLGEPDGSGLSPNARALADALTAAGASVQVPADIRAALWEKLVFIAAVSGVGAVSRSAIGEVRQCEPTYKLLQRLVEEVAAVARARGIQLHADVIPRTLSFIDNLPADGTASMQRDMAAAKPSELEAIIGSVVRFGRECGTPVPAMEYVYASLLPQELRARRQA